MGRQGLEPQTREEITEKTIKSLELVTARWGEVRQGKSKRSCIAAQRIPSKRSPKGDMRVCVTILKRRGMGWEKPRREASSIRTCKKEKDCRCPISSNEGECTGKPGGVSLVCQPTKKGGEAKTGMIESSGLGLTFKLTFRDKKASDGLVIQSYARGEDNNYPSTGVVLHLGGEGRFYGHSRRKRKKHCERADFHTGRHNY